MSTEVVVPKVLKTTHSQKNYGISIVNAEDFWQEGYKGQGVNIAVIDSGCDYHEELNRNIIDVFNLTTDDNGNLNVVTDHYGHGTHVAGIIAATNESNLIGIAPEANLVIIKVINQQGNSDAQTLIKGIELALNWRGKNGEKIDIINLSLGSKKDNEELRNVIKFAVSQNVFIVTAAGNEGDGSDITDELSYPGFYEEVIQIGAIDEEFRLAKFSNTNSTIDYLSPGDKIFSTYKDNTYQTLSGTSMAAPQASGAIALLLSYLKSNNIDYTQELVDLYLRLNAIELSGYSEKAQGKGVLHLNKMVGEEDGS
ncbi:MULTISPECIES: S8 family peptidase [Bacillus]|uniref:Peptidase S8 n=2 Tax=Bacillus cereus group TaxID=86661 RepID=A0A2C1DQU0_BACCE|nr:MULTISPECIES: S8 family peptidase [Bacillus cereus group]OFD69946.1 serine protease [Bacillus mycoides]OFD69957.1 serine protease [Bacillus mycoides]OFD70583.1 serine protease [Bacillus mycoides]PGT02591.1 peptidase S8 [Bacillus cereus]